MTPVAAAPAGDAAADSPSTPRPSRPPPPGAAMTASGAAGAQPNPTASATKSQQQAQQRRPAPVPLQQPAVPPRTPAPQLQQSIAGVGAPVRPCCCHKPESRSRKVVWCLMMDSVCSGFSTSCHSRPQGDCDRQITNLCCIILCSAAARRRRAYLPLGALGSITGLARAPLLQAPSHKGRTAK